MFAYKLMRYGHLVSKPIGDGYPYDVLVDNGTNILKVQIKTTMSKENGADRYRFRLRGKNGAYSNKQVDIFALHCYPENQWYLIPFKDIKWDSICVDGKGERSWKEYFDAWEVFNYHDSLTDEKQLLPT